jgi:hypothetical protein
LRIKAAKQLHVSGREVALLSSAHDCNPANEPLAFPKKQTKTVCTFLRRDVAAIKDRSSKAVAIAEKIAETHALVARHPNKITFEGFRPEEIPGHGSCPSGNYRQGWIPPKCETDHAAGYRDRKHLLDSSPKRIDIHRAVQAEQRSFQRRIDNRLQIAVRSDISP